MHGKCMRLAWLAWLASTWRLGQVVLSLRLTEAEVEKVVLDPKEYETSMWITPAELLAGHYHPALKLGLGSGSGSGLGLGLGLGLALT